MIDGALLSRGTCAVGTAVEVVPRFDPVPDDLASTVITDGRQLLDGAIEAIERVSCTGGHNLERQLVVVAAHLTPRHRSHPQEIHPPPKAFPARNLCASATLAGYAVFAWSRPAVGVAAGRGRHELDMFW